MALQHLDEYRKEDPSSFSSGVSDQCMPHYVSCKTGSSIPATAQNIYSTCTDSAHRITIVEGPSRHFLIFWQLSNCDFRLILSHTIEQFSCTEVCLWQKVPVHNTSSSVSVYYNLYIAQQQLSETWPVMCISSMSNVSFMSYEHQEYCASSAVIIWTCTTQCNILYLPHFACLRHYHWKAKLGRSPCGHFYWQCEGLFRHTVTYKDSSYTFSTLPHSH